MNRYSIVIPAYNEAGAVGEVLGALLAGPLKDRSEIIVVNDCSSDATAHEVSQYPVTLLSNVQNFGYGYSLKRGITHAKEAHIIILDADGSYPVSALPVLIAEYEKGFDMVVGARQGVHYRGSLLKYVARFFFRVLSEFTTGRHIPDINSGLRIFRRDVAMRFFPTLSSGFSFTTTITLAFMLNARSVSYLSVSYHKRVGVSKVRYLRDTLRSTQIITEAIIYYNPLKLFLLCTLFVLCIGVASALVALVSVVAALLLFLTFFGSTLLLSLGFLAVLMRHTGLMRTGEHELQ